jgi:hypothetical protein
MQNITKRQCLDFVTNPTTNPLTKRKIKVQKRTYETLLRSCHKEIKAPASGPMIHWMKDKSILKQYDNLLRFVNYIYAHIKKWEAADFTGPYSKMLLEEYREILTISKEQFQTYNEKIYILSSSLIDKIDNIRRTKMVLNDVPKSKTIGKMKVKPSRLYIRKQVLKIYIMYKKFLALKEPTKKQIKYVLKKKAYLDYIVGKKIFRKEDIFGKLFPEEQNFLKSN